MQPRILIFDSGVGGLSLVPSLRDALPGASFVHVSDNAAHPYGTRTAREVVLRIRELAVRLRRTYRPDVMIIACNTASTVALPTVRRLLDIPVIGVVPAIKPAAAISRTRHIALLATPATVARGYTHRLIATHARDCRVLRFGTSELVGLAEFRLQGVPPAMDALEAALEPMIRHRDFRRVDTVVLGCTHFPLLQPELAAVVDRPLHWIDSGEAIARRAREVCGQIPCPDSGHATDIAVFTRDDSGTRRLRPALERLGFARLQILSAPYTPDTSRAVV